MHIYLGSNAKERKQQAGTEPDSEPTSSSGSDSLQTSSDSTDSEPEDTSPKNLRSYWTEKGVSTHSSFETI